MGLVNGSCLTPVVSIRISGHAASRALGFGTQAVREPYSGPVLDLSSIDQEKTRCSLMAAAGVLMAGRPEQISGSWLNSTESCRQCV